MLNNAHFIELCNECIKTEPKFKPVIDQYGYPPFWLRTLSSKRHNPQKQSVIQDSKKTLIHISYFIGFNIYFFGIKKHKKNIPTKVGMFKS
jgi:hypothetical protein